MINENKNYAVLGASQNPDKFGYKVLEDLLKAGFAVFPVNPKRRKILDQKVYKTLSDIPEKVDVAIFVVPPPITEKILKEAHKLGIKEIWLQPGSESEKALKFCKEKKMRCVHNSCIMLKRRA